MLPDFGCGIHDLVFAPNNADDHRRGRRPAVREALVRYEPRIDVLDVDADAAPGGAEPAADPRRLPHPRQQRAGNLVYPFYITEGT